MKEFSLAVATLLMGSLTFFFACTAAEGDVIEGWIVWYLAAASFMALLAMAIGLVGTDE